MSFKESFVLWKRDPITKAMFESMDQRLDLLKEELAVSAGIDPLQDRYRAGYIQAIRDFSDIDLVDKEDA